MRYVLGWALGLSLVAAGCSKPSEKPISSEAEMRAATDAMVKRQMEQMGKPAPGGAPNASAQGSGR